MKKIVLFLAMLLTATCLKAQTAEEIAVLQRFKNMFSQAQEDARAGNYARAESQLLDLLELFDKQNELLKFRAPLGLVYYNIAQYRSMQDKREGAIAALETAAGYGWNNYDDTMRGKSFDNIRQEAGFDRIMARIKENGDFLHILRSAETYLPGTGEGLPAFTYMPADDSGLVRVREYFNLDSIAGDGDEISKIKNLLDWVHNVVRHDGSSMSPSSKNAIDMVELCKEEGRGINCRMMAQVLNECYLAIGIKSRFVTCMPKVYVDDCHVINAVYSETLGKWLWVDPTFNAYVMDEHGVMLGIGEVRDRLRDGRPLVLCPEANWNNEYTQTKEQYLDSYMTKNLYYMICPLDSRFDAETNIESGERSDYIFLVPPGYAAEDSPGFVNKTETNDDNYFWQPPV